MFLHPVFILYPQTGNYSISESKWLKKKTRSVVDIEVNPVESQSTWGSHGTVAGAIPFLAVALRLVWEMTKQTGTREASPGWHQRFVLANPLKRVTVKHAVPRSQQCQLRGHQLGLGGWELHVNLLMAVPREQLGFTKLSHFSRWNNGTGMGKKNSSGCYQYKQRLLVYYIAQSIITSEEKSLRTQWQTKRRKCGEWTWRICPQMNSRLKKQQRDKLNLLSGPCGGQSSWSTYLCPAMYDSLTQD